MSERKVLNKYYPPDFDPSKIPRVRQARNRQFTVRLMAPCNMCCNTCGEYIYKGKKFNARKEDVESDTYLGIRIYRFYIKCTRCLAEISFKTDPESTDYVIEAGATRNFMALKLAEEQAEREEAAEKEDDATNPMKLLEKRTQASRNEMAVLEALEELKELSQRNVAPDYDNLLSKYDEKQKEPVKMAIEEEFSMLKELMDQKSIRRIEDPESSESEEEGGPPVKKSLLTQTLFEKDAFLKKTPVTKKAPLVVIKSSTAVKSSNSKEASSTLTKGLPTQGEEKKATPLPSGLGLLASYDSDSTSD